MRAEKHGAGIQETEKSLTFAAQMVLGCSARAFRLKRESGERPEQNPLLCVPLPGRSGSKKLLPHSVATGSVRVGKAWRKGRVRRPASCAPE